ncbi:MAG: tetratricopeptide repeat protein, partial [Anaerolineae bacterium]|nr:tetratricopeptide repeat protein [Anaerolineae bacterium]
ERMAMVEDAAKAGESEMPLPPIEPAAEVPQPAAAQMQVIMPVELAHAELPNELNLPAGERQALPTWITVTATQVAVAVDVPPVVEDVPAPAPQLSDTPDWLRETDEQPVAQVPDWLSEGAVVDETPVELPVPVPTPAIETPTPEAPPDISGTLEEARSRYQNDDMDGSLAIYEGLVRTSQMLDDVASDLTGMAREQKSNPVVYRVLGDSLMRQGRLQEALNTYREALNWL